VGPVFSQELRQSISYRADFWIKFFGSILAQVGVAYFLWKAIFTIRGVTEIAGYSFKGMVLYYLLVPLIDRLTRGEDVFQISTEIYDGTLTRYLLYPISFLSYKYVGQMARAFVAFLQLVTGFLFFILVFGLPSEVHLSWLGGVEALVIVVIVMFVYFVLSTLVELIAFWADNVWNLLAMLRLCVQLFCGAMLPLELFPGWAQDILKYTPFPYILSVPIRLLLGKFSFNDFIFGLFVLLGWSLIIGVFYFFVWRAGTKKYSGVGL
jgi:ABC-2 type transport system permease protein